MRQRIITAILIGIPILGLLFYSNETRTLFLAILAVLMSWEYLTLFSDMGMKLISRMGTFALGLVLMVSSYLYSDQMLSVILPLVLISHGILILSLVLKTEELQIKNGTVWNILYVVLPLATLIAFRHSQYFSVALISTVLLIWISDSGAYFVGRSIGTRKLFPSVSPGKTWEGFLGAGLLSVLFSYVFYSYYNIFDVRTWALIGLIIWFFGSMGDLVESKLKRKLGVKDSSNIMPGHGGFLDRFDAFIFAAPFVVALIYYFN